MRTRAYRLRDGRPLHRTGRRTPVAAGTTDAAGAITLGRGAGGDPRSGVPAVGFTTTATAAAPQSKAVRALETVLQVSPAASDRQRLWRVVLAVKPGAAPGAMTWMPASAHYFEVAKPVVGKAPITGESPVIRRAVAR